MRVIRSITEKDYLGSLEYVNDGHPVQVDYGYRWTSNAHPYTNFRLSWDRLSEILYAVSPVKKIIIELGRYSEEEMEQLMYKWETPESDIYHNLDALQLRMRSIIFDGN